MALAAAARSTKCAPTFVASSPRARPTAWRPANVAASPRDLHRDFGKLPVQTNQPFSALFDGLNDDLDATVVGAAFGRLVVGDGAALSDAGGRDDGGRDAARDEVVTHGLRSLLREHDVLGLGALRVGVTLDDHLVIGLVLESIGDCVELSLGSRQQIPFGRL